MGLGSPLIVVLIDPEPGLAQRLVEDEYHVYAAYSPDVVGAGHRLKRPWRHNLQKALTSAGLIEEEAHRFARASGRSLTVLRRLMPAAPHFKPRWADNVPTELIAAMLASGWDETSETDKKIVATIAGASYNEVEEKLAPLATLLDGPIVRSGALWKIRSLRDLWTLVGSQVTPGQLERFEAAFQQVLGAVNPHYDTDPKELWFRRPDADAEQASYTLRDGLLEAMVALGVYPEALTLISNAGNRAGQAVRRLLDKADRKLWWSLSRNFRRLAEASPKDFLDAVEAALEGDASEIKSLFRSDEGFVSPTEYLSELLWALEILARSPDYLMQSALILARLDQLDPGGQRGNRPGASLRQIFLTWFPQTYATPERRLKVIDRILVDNPDSGWKLLVALAPHSHSITHNSPHPDWRDFTPDDREELTWHVVDRAYGEIGRRLLEYAGEDGARWRSLLNLWANFDAQWRGEAANQLRQFAANLTISAEIVAMREALRAFLRRHRDYAHAEWAMPEEDLQPLEEVFQALEPASLQDRHRWLFQPGTRPPRPGVSWEVERAELETDQATAVEELLASLSSEEFWEFAATVILHNALGWAIAKTALADERKDSLLKFGLLADDKVVADVVAGLLFGLSASRGEKWVHSLWKRAIDEE